MDMRPMLSVKECANILGVSPKWFYSDGKPSAAEQAGLRLTRIGKHLRIRPADLEEFIESNTKGA